MPFRDGLKNESLLYDLEHILLVNFKGIVWFLFVLITINISFLKASCYVSNLIVSKDEYLLTLVLFRLFKH